MLFCIPIAVGVTVAFIVSDITSIEVVSADDDIMEDDVIVDVDDIIILLLVDDNAGLVSVMTDLVTTTPNVVWL